jgi:hypothetical protein
MERRLVGAILVMLAIAGAAAYVVASRANKDEPPEAARARTTPALVWPTAIPTATWDPRSQERMSIGGSVWIDARPARALVEVFAGSEKCAQSTAGTGPDDYITDYHVIIRPASEPSMCGIEGVPISFIVDGNRTAETVAWQRGADVRVDLVVGPAFSRYYGLFAMPEYDGYNILLQPVIDGRVCGQQLNALRGEGPDFDYDIVVDPQELITGCGREGAIVLFRVVAMNDMREVVRVLTELPEIERWSPGEFVATSSARMGFHGTLWIDARLAPLDVELEAYVDGARCAATRLEIYASDLMTGFVMVLPPEVEQSGCGRRGATLGFKLNGREANESYDWNPLRPGFTDVFGRAGVRPLPGKIHPRTAPPRGESRDSSSDRRQDLRPSGR